MMHTGYNLARPQVSNTVGAGWVEGTVVGPILHMYHKTIIIMPVTITGKGISLSGVTPLLLSFNGVTPLGDMPFYAHMVYMALLVIYIYTRSPQA